MSLMIASQSSPVAFGGLGLLVVGGDGVEVGGADGGGGGPTGGVAALEEGEGEADGEQDGDGHGGDEAGPGHGTSLGAETALTRMVSGGWLGSSTCSRVSRTRPVRTTWTRGGSGSTSIAGGTARGAP